MRALRTTTITLGIFVEQIWAAVRRQFAKFVSQGVQCGRLDTGLGGNTTEVCLRWGPSEVYGRIPARVAETKQGPAVVRAEHARMRFLGSGSGSIGTMM